MREPSGEVGLLASRSCYLSSEIKRELGLREHASTCLQKALMRNALKNPLRELFYKPEFAELSGAV